MDNERAERHSGVMEKTPVAVVAPGNTERFRIRARSHPNEAPENEMNERETLPQFFFRTRSEEKVMQTTLNRLTSPVRFLFAGTWLSLFAVLSLGLCAATASAAQKPPIVVSGTPVQLGALTGGGWDGSQEPIGGTFVVGFDGSVLTGNGYGSNFLQLTLAGSDTTLAAGVGGSAAALDQYGNLYFGGNYNSNVYKVPFYNGAYVGWSGTAPTAACTGGTSDQVACVFAPAVSTFMGSIAGAGASGYAGVAFDAQGNFFFESNTLPATTPNSIFECDTSCQANSSATPKLIYSDASPVGAMQIDPWGNIFFVDGNNAKGKATNLNEIVLSSGTYAATPVVVLSYTNAAGYGNGISGLAISGTGTIYISVNGDGLFAIPNTKGSGPSVAGMYQVSTQGGKGVAVDSKGNLYGIPYNSGDVVSYIPVNNFAFGTEPAGTAATAVTATILDSDGACTPTLAAAATKFGVASSEFSATVGSSCSAGFGGGNGVFASGPLTAAGFSAVSVTLNFTPSKAGSRNAALVVTDSTNSATGVAVLSGVGQAAQGNVDPGVTTTYNTGLTDPTSIVADKAGDVFIADAGAGKVYEVAAGQSSLTPIGSGFTSPAALAFDVNDNLFVADNAAFDVIEIPNTSTTGAFAAGTQSTPVSSTMLFGSKALGSATALAVGLDGTLYISDPANHRVVYYNLVNSQAGVTLATAEYGISTPAGLALDASNNLYIADSGQNAVVKLSGTTFSKITNTNIAEAIGVAVDPSGSVLIADGASGNIVRIPDESGTLTGADAITIETLASASTSMWMDGSGNLYVSSGGGQAAYAIQRNAVSVTIPTVADGATGTGTIYLMNSGNADVTLATPDLTQPTSTLFLLAPGATNGCTAGSSGPSGDACTFTATFAPPAGSNDSGPYSDSTGAILLATPAESIPITISSTASVSSLQPQTITYNPAVPTSGFVGQQVALSATATSGLTVVLSSPTPSACTLSASTSPATVTLIGTGTCTINANQAGGNNNSQVWGAAPQVTSNITVKSATATGIPALVVNQATWIGDFGVGYSGGFTSGANPDGGSFGINSLGAVVDGNSYGTDIQIWTPSSSNGYPATYTLTKIPMPSSSNVAGVSVDGANNIYGANLYYHQIWKVPYVSGAYATTVPTSVPNCAGSGGTTPDATFCAFSISGFANGESEIYSTAFDGSGNMFLASEMNSTGQNGIYEIPAASLAQISSGSVAMTPIYTSDTNTIASLAIDAMGNLFFTDIQYGSTSGGAPVDASHSTTYASSLFELANTGTAAAPTYSNVAPGQTGGPVLLVKFTNASGQVGQYDNALSGVAVDRTSGIVYFSTISDGIWAFADSGTPFTSSSLPIIYAVAGSNGTSTAATDMTGGKGLAVGAAGTVYAVGADASSDDLYMLTIGSVIEPNAAYQGAPVNASVKVVDNALAWCPSPAATLSFTFAGTGASTFSGNQGSGCSAVTGGGGWNGSFAPAINVASTYPTTITFTPDLPNAQTATLAVSDTTNGGTGSGTINALAQTTPQTIAFTAPTTTTYTYTAPPSPVTITLTVANGPSNNPVAFTVDAKSTGAGTISSTTVTGTNSSATLTVTQAGTIIIDANEAGGLVNSVYYNAAPQMQLTLTIGQAAQAIVFTPISGSPFTYVAPPNQVTIQLSATGGASANPVTFSVDPSSTGAGTVSATTTVGNASLATLTITQAGSIVIDAAQAGNTNYAAVSLMNAQTIQVNQAAQTITFIPPSAPIHFIGASTGIAGGITVQVSATGGASNNPIVFTVDASSTMKGSFSTSTVSGATSTATLTIPLQGSVTSGNIVIDATQPASTDYAAVTDAPLATITILAPLPLQTISWANPGTQVSGNTLALNGTASSALPVIYTSSTTTVCTMNGTTATFVAAGTCTITATQPGDNAHFAAAPPVTQSFTVNAAGKNPNVSLNLSLTSLILQSGTVGTSNITITSQNNFTGAVVFTCSGAPSGYTCSFTPAASSTNPLILQANQSAGVTLAVSGSGTASLERGPRPFVPLATLAAALFLIGFRKRNRIFLVVLIVLSAAGLSVFSGCGGSSSIATKPTTSSLTVTATASGMSGASGSVTQSATVSVTTE